MVSKLALAKLQFHVDSCGQIRTFRRTKKLMLFKGDQPLRQITYDEWAGIRNNSPIGVVAAERLSVRDVWILVEKQEELS